MVYFLASYVLTPKYANRKRGTTPTVLAVLLLIKCSHIISYSPSWLRNIFFTFFIIFISYEMGSYAITMNILFEFRSTNKGFKKQDNCNSIIWLLMMILNIIGLPLYWNPLDGQVKLLNKYNKKGFRSHYAAIAVWIIYSF